MNLLRTVAACAAFAAFTAAAAGTVQAQVLSGADLVHALQRGGYVVVMRHASSPVRPPEGADVDPANLNRERQLDSVGRETAVAMGRAIKALHLPIGEVWTSPTFRAHQTVALADLPRANNVPQLGDGGQSMSTAGGDQAAWLRAAISQTPRPGTDTVMVTHLPNLTAAFGERANGLPDGGALVFRPVAGAPPELVGRIRIEEWPRLAGIR